MKKKVYVDGQSGTTGLQILERLNHRSDIELLKIDPTMRRDKNLRHSLMKEADLVILCLPDEASREAVAMMEDCTAKIIDCSTAFRTDPEWVYGFPQLDAAHQTAIQQSGRVANPGCHASGFIALVYPLIQSGLLDPSARISCFSLTGYTGGGKAMIEAYENNPDQEMRSPKVYGLDLHHKHLPEMKTVCRLEKTPLFVPVVDDFPQGMLVQVLIAPEQMTRPITVQELQAAYAAWYQDPVITVGNPQKALHAGTLAGSDKMEIFVQGSDEGFVLSCRFDNLGKGASGAAVANMNLMLGLDPYAGLTL